MKAKIFVTLIIVGQMAFAQDDSLISYGNFLGASALNFPLTQSSSRIIAGQKPHLSFVPKDPWHEIDGRTNFAGIWEAPATDSTLNGKVILTYVPLDSGWREVSGKVLEVQLNGIRISIPGRIAGETEYFVANFPYRVAEDDYLPPGIYTAKEAGTYTYPTAIGGSRTIHQLDYGHPCGPSPEYLEWLKQTQAAAQLASKQEAKKIKEAEVRAVLWLQSKATNGDASAQFFLGKHYLNGEGCETNRELAIDWFRKAATQGSLEASNELVSLKVSQ